MAKALILAMAIFACGATSAVAQTPPASIEQAAWLAGRWVGEGLGGQLEETWSPPTGGQMVGHFRLARDGAPVFYEIMLMDVAETGVRMRVKHFNPDFVGWEEKGEWHTFEPLSNDGDTLAFDGLTLRRNGDALEIRIIIHYSDGAREEVLRLHRAPL